MRMVLSMFLSSLLLPAFAAAQQARPARGTMIGASAGARFFAASPSMRVTGSGRVRRMQTTGVEFSSFQTFPTFPVQTVSFDNVPGLGFDFPHLAAVTRGQPRHRPIFEPIGFPGIFFSPLAEPPTVVIVQQPPVVEVPEYPGESLRDNDSDSVPERVAARRESTPARAARQPETPPLEPAPAAQQPQDSAQYVFVQRDGSLLFAVAYSWEKGMLRYITPEGLRRSVGGDKLDLDATQQFNEQRGLVFRSPA